MFELKYFGKIATYEEREATTKDPKRPPPFNIEALGMDNTMRRVARRFAMRFMLFAFFVMRGVWPVARIGRLVVVTRYKDVLDVLNKSQHFRVPFGPEMKTLTGGVPFALGLDLKDHRRQRDVLDVVVSRDDTGYVLDRTRYFTEALIKSSGGRIDVMRDLLGRVFTETCSDYFGLDLDDPNAFLDRSMAISALLFADPLGNEDTRSLALNGAVRIRYLVDRAIERTRSDPRKAPIVPVVDRLANHKMTCGGQLTADEIRAMVIGVMTGILPTNTLAAGKMIEELHRSGRLQSAIAAAKAAEDSYQKLVKKLERDSTQANKHMYQRVEEARRANRCLHRHELWKILLEAARLNPALLPGQFRYAPKATTIDGRDVPAGSVLVVATASALRDGAIFDRPRHFDADRVDRMKYEWLMFGDGAHKCLGIHLALEQITEIFQILLSQPEIRPVKHPTGWLSYVGPFPRRFDFEFETILDPRNEEEAEKAEPERHCTAKPQVAEEMISPSTQSLITIAARVDRRNADKLRRMVEALGNPAKPGSAMHTALDKTGIVHFASLSVLETRDPDNAAAESNPYLVLELNVDGKDDEALATIARETKAVLGPVFELVEGTSSTDLLRSFNDCKITLHSLPWGPIGLNFNGTPDCSVGDIERQLAVTTFARKALDHYLKAHKGVSQRPMEALNYIRSLTRPADAVSSKTTRPSDPNHQRDEDKLRGEGIALRKYLIRPTRRRLRISEWTGCDAKIGFQGVIPALQSNAGAFIGLMLLATLLIQGGAIHYAVENRSWLAVAVATAGALVAGVLLGVLFIRNGFDRLVRIANLAGEGVAQGVTALLLVLSGILFVAFVVLRWIAVPAFLVAAAAVSFWAVRRWLPGTSTIGEIGLTVAGVIAITLTVLGVVAAIRRNFRIAVSLAVGGGAAFWALQHWLPYMSPSARIVLAMVSAIILAGVVQWLHLRKKPFPPLVWRVSGWGILFLAVIAAGLLLDIYWAKATVAISATFAWLGTASLAIIGGFVATFLIWAIPTAVFLLILLWHEMGDKVDERPAPIEHIKKIADSENAEGYAQNHITAVTLMKPGPFRKLTLALTLWTIGKEIQYWFRPGFVLNMGTIHYAKWFRLPGTEMMLFLANYDGSWQSYLEDFITKAHEGQSAVWSHGQGFPKTRLLVFHGAADGDRFKRWVRRQQVVTQFWYSRFPQLTTEQIRTNAMIHDGLMRAQTDTSARAWLDCFGTMPRPANFVESEEVQSLVFRGLPNHQYMLCAAVTFDGDDNRRRWLAKLPDKLTFGEQPDVEHGTATFVAFSARGIEKCLGDVDRTGVAAIMEAFPPAFRLGMGSRGRILGDTGTAALDEWRWADVERGEGAALAGPTEAIDALILIYGKSKQACELKLAKHATKLGLYEKDIVTVMTEPTARSKAFARVAGKDGLKELPMYEHFGFRDGISQPVIRGSQRAMKVTDVIDGNDGANDIVEPGELILGYVNSGGYTAPAITLPAERDDDDDLETDSPEFPSRFPRFSGSRDADRRDFGRNGTFLAVRQLKQDVPGFKKFLKEQKKELEGYSGLPAAVGGAITTEWIAAKMMGRWRNGASLIAWPHAMRNRKPPSTPDNDFSYAKDDPQGLRCPFGAHIRRANPRGSLAPDDPQQATIERRHRILRRGRAYGEGNGEKGLLFVGVCADLERQFEFLQQTWIASPFFHGLSNEPDPFTAAPPARGTYEFTIPTPSGAVKMKGVPNFVTMKGGGYFFMPGRSAMRYLARLADKARKPASPGVTIMADAAGS